MKAKQKPPPKPTKAEQRRRFIEAAREIGADENGDVFEKAFKAIVPPKRPATKNTN